ncbi:hypothetical protein EIP91_010591 [Steccherinum ochraceum]|uniref:Uncharacterized protein n=1 Tax=Steccherinum ochraceum TaxID=92696 RepID=A0A4R0R5R2_9APHY|nr:hypothetical protein EIP91_010591 [Steccherinum ochraceum]
MAPSALVDTAAAINAKFSDMYIPDSYAYDLSHLAPIDRLPVELLIDIFVSVARQLDGSPFAPLLLSHVCHGWRDIVLACPRIWQFLYLKDSKPRLSTEFQSLLWLRLSKQHPLDVRIDLSDQDLLLPLLIPLLPHIDRWRCWHLTGKIEEQVDFTSFSKDGSRAILEDVQITIRGVTELNDLDTTEGPNRPSIFASDPSYLRPDVHMVRIRLDVLSLPPPSLMSAMMLRNLTISESTPEGVSDPIRMLEFLQFCPSVETFHYYGFPQEPPAYPEPPARPPIVTLPRLRVLMVRSTCAVRTILSHITAPCLAELYLEHTNVEFEPDIATYPYEVEDGDSDDENQDFSQSPWSDHATGMGLRSLLRRSNPPLEVLAMDYADMRTKDFEWCFDRMERLQEFRIVASDMSDKVISMLAPFRKVILPSPPAVRPALEDELGSDSDSTSSFPSPTSSHASTPSPSQPPSTPAPTTKFPHSPSPSSSLQIRLPHLTSLELWNCQRLTGDAIVHALRARTRFTDEGGRDGHGVAEGGRGRMVKMEEVAVIGCSDFYPRHALDLGVALGSRLRIN